jgi:cytoskeleton protein RodZ
MNEKKKKASQVSQGGQDPLIVVADDVVLPEAGGLRVSDFLKTHRLRNKLSLSQVSQELRIREDYLLAIEEEDQRRLPEMAYTLGFVRSYAALLGFDGAEVVRMFKVEQDFDKHVPEINDLVSQVSERSIPSKRILLVAALGILSAVFLGMLLRGGKTNNVPAPEMSSDLALDPIKDAATVESQSAPAALAPSPDSLPLKPQESSASLAPSQPLDVPAAGPIEESHSSSSTVKRDLGEGGAVQETSDASSMLKNETENPASLSERQLQSDIKEEASAIELPPLSNGPAVLKAQDKAWVRVFYADGRIVVDRVMNRGETLDIQLGQKLFLSTGNLGSLHIEMDGHSYLLKGKMGEVKRSIPLEADVLNDYVIRKSKGH